MKSVLRSFKKKSSHSGTHEIPEDASIIPFHKLPRKASRLLVPLQSEPPRTSSPKPLTHSRSECNLKTRSNSAERHAEVTSISKTNNINKISLNTPQGAEVKSAGRRSPRPPPLRIHNSTFNSTMDQDLQGVIIRVPSIPKSPPEISDTDGAKVPELHGIWEGFLQDVQDDLNSPDTRGLHSSSHQRKYSSDSDASDDFSVFDALPTSLSRHCLDSNPDLFQNCDIPESPNGLNFSLSLFPAPPSGLWSKQDQCSSPISIHPIIPSSEFPSSPSTLSDSSTLSTPRASTYSKSSSSPTSHTQGHAKANNIRFPLSPTTGALPVNARLGQSRHLPLRSAKSALNLRAPLTHKVTSSGSTAYSVPQDPVKSRRTNVAASPLGTSFSLPSSNQKDSPSVGPVTIQFGYAM